MTVASWEYWSVAKMLVITHGREAELVARKNYDDALDAGHSGDIIVWREIQEKIAVIRANLDTSE